MSRNRAGQPGLDQKRKVASTMKISDSVHRGAAACLLAASLFFPLAHASAAELRLADIIRTPVDISLSGYVYSDSKKTFSLDVSRDRFIKSYSDGVTIIGFKEGESAVYYLVDWNKKTVSKISQGNLYRTGQFFSWSSMTTLLDLPGNTAVVPHPEKAGDCASYQVAHSDIELCVDESRHLLRKLTKRKETIAQVTSVKQLSKDLKNRSDAILRTCQEQHYNFLDIDAELSPEAD